MIRSCRRLLRQMILAPLLLISLGACDWFRTTPMTYDIALGDLDSDGDLDAFFANGEEEYFRPDTAWFNLGEGDFVDSGQVLGNADSHSIALGDLDGDQDLDALDGGRGDIYINDGHGNFINFERAISPVDGSYTRYASLGDLDHDGDLDLLLAGCCGAYSSDGGDTWVIPPASTVMLNDGAGHFVESQTISDQGCQAASLGDLDGDGDLDAFIACWASIEHSGVPADVSDLFGSSERAFQGPIKEQTTSPNRVFLNNGAGEMLDSGQSLGDTASFSIALGDLDGDGDLDAFVGNQDDDEIWINQGGAQGGIPARFALSPQRIANQATQKIALGDVDGDGDLDVLLTIFTSRRIVTELWSNDGRASFMLSRQHLSIPEMQVYTLGDIDNDGDLDIFAGSFDRGYGVRRNDGKGNFEK